MKHKMNIKRAGGLDKKIKERASNSFTVFANTSSEMIKERASLIIKSALIKNELLKPFKDQLLLNYNRILRIQSSFIKRIANRNAKLVLYLKHWDKTLYSTFAKAKEDEFDNMQVINLCKEIYAIPLDVKIYVMRKYMTQIQKLTSISFYLQRK